MDNRPFGEEEGLVPIKSYSTDDDGLINIYTSNDFLNVPIGTEFVVDYNGVLYPCIRFGAEIDNTPYHCVGNLGLAENGKLDGTGSVSDDTLPFLICTTVNEHLVITKDPNAKVTIGNLGTILTPLDEKFIPDTIARKSDITGGGSHVVSFKGTYREQGDSYEVSELNIPFTVEEAKRIVQNGEPVYFRITHHSDQVDIYLANVYTDFSDNGCVISTRYFGIDVDLSVLYNDETGEHYFEIYCVNSNVH